MIEKIDAKLRKLEPILGPQKVKKWLQMYLMEDDFRAKSEIENHIDLILSRHLSKSLHEEILLPPPPVDLCTGDIPLGEAEYLDKRPLPFSLKLTDVNRHIGIFGSTGTGKTTLAIHIIRQLHHKKIPFLVIDWEKSYRNLADEFPDLEVFTIGKDEIKPLFLNMLNVPPGISCQEYAKSLIALLSEDFLSGAGSDSMFLQYLEATYDQHESPTFTELKNHIIGELEKEMRKKGRLGGRSGLWKETVLRIIKFLSIGSSGSILNSNKHFPLEKLFNRPVVLEFGNIKSPRDRKFFIHLILNWLSLYLEHRGILAEELRQIIIFEEFHNIALKSKEDNMVSNLFREGRKYGLGLIAIDQTPSEIPNAIFANMNVKISFALATDQDISAMAKAMNLEFNCRRYLGMLATGQAVISVKQNVCEPFLLRIPFSKSSPNISDIELKQAMERFSEDSHVICLADSNSSPSNTPHKLDTPRPAAEITLTGMEKVVLADIVNHPFDGVDKRTKRLGLHPSEMKQLHDSLVKNSLVRPVLVDNLKLFEITGKGREKTKTLGLKIPKQTGRGGLEHSYVVKQITDHLIRIGLDPQNEVRDIDIVVDDPGPLVAIEVETGKSNIHTNLGKLTRCSSSNCFMIATKKEVAITLKGFVGMIPNLRAIYFKDFLKLSKDEILVRKNTGTVNRT